MSPLVQTVLFIFGLIALGYLAGALGYLRAEAGEGLSEFVVRIGLPVLLFQAMVTADFHGANPFTYWAAYFAAVILAWAAGQGLMRSMLGLDPKTAIIGGVSSSYGNIFVLGAPFILGAYGKEGFEILSLLVSIHFPAIMAASIVIFQLAEENPKERRRIHETLRHFLKTLVFNPMIFAILAGLAWRLTGIGLPGLAGRFVEALGVTAGPLALFGTGLGLRRFGLAGHIRPAGAVAFIKLGLMPAAMLLFAWLIGLPPLTAKVAVAAASLPCGVNSYLIAVQFRTGEALASSATVLTTILAAATTAVWLAAAQAVFG